MPVIEREPPSVAALFAVDLREFYLLIPFFFMWFLDLPCFDIVPFDIPVVPEVLPLVSEAPAGGCAGFLLESFILGRLFPV
ncbi:hypothetical protein [Nitrobacter sp. 62-13]|jgi:hypothetical protein|uniref:hypothetical protein n=1 Tax=Nitrobacter sp. 62-13 TaxID=1895797 RepID=UPI0025D094B4|nr:hypothetical protein [Nitrobacter sp. 62-13]